MMRRKKIGIIGLGYVGLPLAVIFAKKYNVIGFDISKKRVAEIKSKIDSTLEITSEELNAVITEHSNDEKSGLYPTDNSEYLEKCEIYIVTVPTPIDKNNKPNLNPLKKASEIISNYIKKEDIVIYESTVYPGATEDFCIPIIEKGSNLKFEKDFYAGYSPERINPGDKERTIEKILKITSGSNPKVAKEIDQLYKSVISAGTYLAPSIKVAEAAKVIENSQRDINIAFVNELAKIFNILNIDTNEVLLAAGTKWNFLKYKPGLVGGHCIGVDPYYIATKAESAGYYPEIILAGRRLNDSMGIYIADQITKIMLKNKIPVISSKILVLGITFKENCPDIRNSKVVDLIKELIQLGSSVDIWDPWAKKSEVEKEFGIKIFTKCPEKKYDTVVLAVAHKEFIKFDFSQIVEDKNIIYDIKSVLKGKNIFRL
tara:strand:- start:1299 stop:2585 length:1287 start_codon:yes stop_codon:yes gene_type:complete